MKKILSLVTVFAMLFQVILLPASAKVQDETITTVEAYSIETLSDTPNDEGLYEKTGYKNVNAITEVIQNGDRIVTKMYKVEDIYDIDENYINTVISAEEFQNDFKTGKAKSRKQVKEYNQASAISESKPRKNIREAVSSFELTKAKENEVQENVKHFINDLDEGEFEDVQGIKKSDLEKVKKLAAEIKKSGAIKFDTETKRIEIDQEKLASLSSVEAAGAFDNYYNHNLSTGAFTAQALSQAPHKYIKITGTTAGSSKNASSMVKFKRSINEYEYYIIDRVCQDFCVNSINQYMKRFHPPNWAIFRNQ
ncbi:hypothetical protein I532_16233 [Brevibacillus borstelensis AK1]|uniref:Uncharacterized protein n=1 Tax=Brevibacillus borstelensis AK1 TaxID=1300222 RepID=M8D5D0_9BACL|nr:hypothetical protein [Brevibacillus borstelensis]EMT51489.1 hypothetical protein I532_16233 [Brevibacillus borstelensis AK1]